MYQHYIDQWKMYEKQYGPHTCLFLLVGKFYELYDILSKETGEGQTNVRHAVETLGITLTTKKADGPNKEDCLFAGFPEQSLQKFAALMTRDGWTVVVCNQQKNEKGAVTGRPVARIFSPGTHIEAAGAEAPLLAGVWIEERLGSAPIYAATSLDLTTGEIVSYEGIAQGQSDIWSSDNLVHFFQIHPPRETVVWWRGAAIACPTEPTLRRRLGLIKGALHIEIANEKQEGAMENPTVRKSFLERIFSTKLCLLPIMEQLQLRGHLLTERVLVSLLRFAEDHLPSAIQNLHNHTIWSPEKAVYMGNNTLLQLNYISTGTEQSVLSLFQRSLNSLGKRGLRDRLLSPSSDPDEIKERLNEVEFAHTMDTELLKRIESYLRLIHDIARLHRKIVMYTIDATDILALDQSYGSIEVLDTLLNETLLELRDDKRKQLKEYRTLFGKSFDIEKAKQAVGNEDISFLPCDKAPKTAEIEQKLANVKAQLETYRRALQTWANFPDDALRIESQETMSYFFTGTKALLTAFKSLLDKTPADKHPFPDIVVTMKKATRSSITFPALENIHYQILGLRNNLRFAIQNELPIVCNETQHVAWSLMEQWVAHVDVTFTLARVAKERGYKKPDIYWKAQNEASGFEAQGLRHPLLESVQTRIEYVKHDVSLGFNDTDDEGWLLYGMNASGKSSLMKAIGISVLLAQAGSFVPATSFKLCPFKSILTRILNQDNLWAGLSSFAVEIAELRDIFQRSNERSLVLGDELCSGTESISATSLVAAGIHYLHKQSARYVFATHLHGLHSIPEIQSLEKLGTWHLRVHYDAVADTLVYDRTLHKGPGGTLYGLEVARAMHMPHDILKLAHSYRKQLLGEVGHSEAESSSWNTNVYRKDCEVCHKAIVRDLEVHHIKPRAEAKMEGTTSTMNDIRNLIVVCQECHDKHHAGDLEITPQKQTSSGPQRIVAETPKTMVVKLKKKKWSDEETAAIETYLREYPNLAISRLVYDLKQTEGITISESMLRKMRLELSPSS